MQPAEHSIPTIPGIRCSKIKSSTNIHIPITLSTTIRLTINLIISHSLPDPIPITTPIPSSNTNRNNQFNTQSLPDIRGTISVRLNCSIPTAPGHCLDRPFGGMTS